MKPSSLLTGTVVAAATALAQQKAYAQVTLAPPLDWVAGPLLFPVNVIAGYNSNHGDYTRDSWASYVLAQCQTIEACTSTVSFSAINSGTPKDRFWFGYVFRGGPTTQTYYERQPGVEDSVVYSVAE